MNDADVLATTERHTDFASALTAWQQQEKLNDADAASFFSRTRVGEEKSISIDTYRNWKLGSPPNSNLHKMIRDVIGFDFRHHDFLKVRRSVAATPSPPVGTLFAQATSYEALRSVLHQCAAEGISADGIVIAVNQPGLTTSLYDFIAGRKDGFASAMLASIFQALDRLEDALNGRIFEIYTPARHLIRQTDQCRRELGITQRTEVATTLDIDRHTFAKLVKDPRLADATAPILLKKEIRKAMVAFIRDAREKIAARQARGEHDMDRWPVFADMLALLEPADVAAAIEVHYERYLSWLRNKGKPQPDELDRIETYLRRRNLYPRQATKPTPTMQPPLESPPELFPPTDGTQMHESAPPNDCALHHRLAIIERRLELLWPLLPEDTRRHAGDGILPTSTTLRFLITADSFQSWNTKHPMTDEEVLDTITLITELRARMKRVAETRDTKAKRTLAPHLAEALIVDHRVFDSIQPTVVSEFIDDARRALGLLSPTTQQPDNQPGGSDA